MEEVYDTAALVSDDAKLKEEEEEKKIQKMKCDDGDGDDEKNTFAIQNLPEGAIAHIFSLLPALSVINCMLTSKQLYRAAVSDGTCWKRQCEKLANIESLDDLRAKARRDIFMNSAKDEEKVKESGEYYRKVFIEMQKNPLMRYRFLKMIPTLGLNVRELRRGKSRRKKMVFGGFSFNAVEGYDEEEEEEEEET